MKNPVITFASWLTAIWAAKVFLSSVPYKFSNHPDTQHIFGTIGGWMKGILGNGIGQSFVDYGAYAVGTVEIIASFVLLLPALLFVLVKLNVLSVAPPRNLLHCLGFLMAAGVMSGAVFFHLFTPLGIEVIHEGKSDNGSLFYAACSILIMGYLMAWLNWQNWKTQKKQ
mgnify:FL=1